MNGWPGRIFSRRVRTVFDAMVTGMPHDFIEAFSPAVEGYGAMPYEVRVRFGMWDDALAMPQPIKPYMPFTNAFHHAARAIAYGAVLKQGKIAEAEQVYREDLKGLPNNGWSLYGLSRALLPSKRTVTMRIGSLKAGPTSAWRKQPQPPRYGYRSLR